MHFSKILPVTLFAALAVAAPAPQGASVPVSQIKQFSENVQSFAGTTESEFNKVKGQQESLANAWQGQGAQVLGQAFDKFAKSVNEVNSVASKLASDLETLSRTYDEAEQASSIRFD
ncbi:hypothetical protein ASPVEDRAFT_80447 [Aspergillus versicolor CBS 583.65]|uniref:WXG100 family type VII secretion target n=1 Tax=Aspergillus versicolor CBS 583.65 TaxID=1036611 RepID=A0A1L9PBD4_ASPVE|nr:uncharacterized protein ASPVEDRAFT_80447 [Aspergillus versicolor CBS 583.65]OJI98816.1 hypothetical protein ASPVEDRAFT_80447 [Aspergillus versicolor CBS 583.65]